MERKYKKAFVIATLCASFFASQAVMANDDDEFYPVRRRLHKRPAEIVVDPTDSTTYYIEKDADSKKGKKGKNDWVKKTQAQKKKLKDSRDLRDRAEHFEMLRAEYNGTKYLNAEERAAKKAAEKAYLDSLLAIEYTVEDYDFGPQPMKWIDEPVTESLSQLQRKVTMAGDVVKAESCVMGHDNNDVFFYYNVKNGHPEKLRLRMQYMADDPLHIVRVVFLINGFFYNYEPTNPTETGQNGPRIYWETLDDELNSTNRDLVYALSHGEWASVIYVGADGMKHRKKLTKKQIEDFNAVLSIYRKQGGKI